MNTICLLDPGIENNAGDSSPNLGDLIIQESVNREIKQIFGSQQLIRFSTHSYLDYKSISRIQTSTNILIGGTNLLSSNMNKYCQWKISFLDAVRIKNAVLLGVGWWQYQGKPNFYTAKLLRFALSGKIQHSVRDNYSKEQLSSIGIRNVINTGCPTMWPLAGINASQFINQKANSALLMLTDYNKEPDLDRQLANLLLSRYESVYFWPQGRGDLEYAREMNLPFKFLDHSFSGLQEFVNSDISFDYIGTRLHGGVYCLNRRKRALIIEIDNRAREIGKDTGLPTVKRDDLAYIEKWISCSQSPRIILDVDAIERWKNQFISVRDTVLA
ncbi:MAG: polysaccharide pyruvyl transferase family protein [Alkalinema sp. RU_4_3]|nr:polysaccharide pyruvyl transferase family protein [Alkalinema sp. RU_4_3]